jgi:hypothetical protein
MDLKENTSKPISPVHAITAGKKPPAKSRGFGAGPVDTRDELSLNNMFSKLPLLLLIMMFGLVELLSAYAKYPTKEHAKTESLRLIEAAFVVIL